MIMSDPEDVATMTGPGEDLEPHPDDTVYKRATEEPWDVLHSIAELLPTDIIACVIMKVTKENDRL